MPSILNEIGAFQFQNLVKNRIPFVLISLGADVAGLFSGFYQSHLESTLVTTNEQQVLSELVARQITKDYALVVLCADGMKSAQVVDRLEAAGYTNVYYLKTGTQNLREELRQI